MKNTILLLTVALGLCGPAAADEQNLSLSIENMTCAICPITVKTALGKVNGVLSVNVDLESNTAKVTYDDLVTDPQSVAAASTNAGYPAKLLGG